MTRDDAPPDTARAHYEGLLASVYTWMIGDLDAAFDRARGELSALGIARARLGEHALDLGAGFGLHARVLSELGYEVTALDSSPHLLGELRRLAPGARAVHGDITDLHALGGERMALVLCMGDTLCHLADEREVDKLFLTVSKRLQAGGQFVLTLRDYSEPRVGGARVIPVRSDDNRIMTCVLSYGDSRVQVTDIVHERREGSWYTRASSYTKLRLSRAFLAAELRRVGLLVERDELEGGVIRLVGRALRAMD